MKCFGSSEKRRTFRCKVVLLDDTQLIQELPDTSRGQDLLDVVCKHLNLLETAYFGLRFIDTTGQACWLDAEKCISKQLKDVNPMTLYFNVKFYASDPCTLVEEITRYQFFLQVKQDILQSRLPVSFELAAELAALAVQSELGDYDPRHHQESYVSEFRFLPNQTPELEARVSELHKGLAGQVPATTEMTFLERTKWLDLYGADLHPVLGEDNVEYFLGLAPSGIIVLRNRSKVGNYFWPRIVKVYRKGKTFMTRVVEKTNEERTYGFRLPSKEACKHLWQCCVEHQAFFKLSQDKESIMKRGSGGKVTGFAQRFRHSVRRGSFNRQSQGQINLALTDRAQPTVVRVPSRRYQRRGLGQPDGADATTGSGPIKDETFKENGYIEVRSSIVVPAGRHVTQPVIYRTASVPGTLPSESPKSARSTQPWENPKQRGLFSSSTHASPKSVRSARLPSRHYHDGHGGGCDVDSNANHVNQRRNSSSSHYRHRQSDGESEVASKCSKSSRHSRHSNRSSNSHHRCRRRHDESGTESDSSRKRHRRRHKCCEKNGSALKLVDSEQQWLEIQKKQLHNESTGQYNGPRAGVAVLRDLSATNNVNHRHVHVSGYANSGHESDIDLNASTLNRVKRKQHLKTLSESGRTRDMMPREIKQHIDYNLIDPTDNDKNDIRYTKVETDSRLFKIRYSPKTGRARGKLTNDSKKLTSAGSTDSKSNCDDSSAQFTPPPPNLMMYSSPRSNVHKYGSAVVGAFHSGSQESAETASSTNSTNSVSRNDSSSSGNMFRPVKNQDVHTVPTGYGDYFADPYGQRLQSGRKLSNMSEGSEIIDSNPNYSSSGYYAKPLRSFVESNNHYANTLAFESGYGAGPGAPRVTFQTPPSTTAYYSSDRTAYNSGFTSDVYNNGFQTPSEMATEL